MLELLEQLSPKFKQELNRHVSMNELTKLSLQLSPKSALVLTNQALYVLRKKWLSIGCDKLSLDEVKEIIFEPGQLIIEPVEVKGQPILVAVSEEKEGIVKHGLTRIRKFLPNAVKRIK
ncbi:MAG: hypothetical protein H0Z35_07255 [Thermoanaerobacteraceae bacterium]|nr:hypothetical protein [Thermoanaerobacteraceae bacterium]